MMDFQEFCQYIRDEMESRLASEGGIFSLEDVLKNNQHIMKGLIYQKPSRGDFHAKQQIYLEAFYKEYQEGTALSTILYNIESKLRQYDINVEDISKMLTKDGVKNSVFPTLINFKNNMKILETLPWKPFLDLAVIYKVMIKDEYMITVTKNLLELVGLDVPELDRAAMENLKKQEPVIEKLSDILGIFEPVGMQVITNEARHWGTGYLLLPEVLEKVAGELGGDYFVIPSSIHEVIAIRKDPSVAAMAENLATFIREVNEAEVAPEERLSDQPYLYDAKEKMLTMPLGNKFVIHAPKL